MGAALSGSVRKKHGSALGARDYCGLVALLRRDVLSVPFALNKLVHSGELQWFCKTLAKCHSRSASLRRFFCQQSLVAGQVVGAHPLQRQMQASMVSVFVWKSARQMFVKSSDGPVNERDSANAIPTLLVHARRSLITIGSDLTLVVTGLTWSKPKTRQLKWCSFLLTASQRCRSRLLKPVVGWTSPRVDAGTGTIALLSWRAEFQHAGLKSSRVPDCCFKKGVWRLWTTWPQPSVWEDGDKRNFLVLTCIRKLAGLCLALDLAVTGRWIPSEVNVSDRPSRNQDPSDVRDKTMTTVVEMRTHRDKMAQRDPRERATTIRSRNGTFRATSLETERKHCAKWDREGWGSCCKGHLVENKVSRSPTLRRAKPLTRDSKALARRHVVNRWRSGDKKELRKLARIRPSRTCPSSRGCQQVTGPKPSTEREWSSSSVLRTRKNWRSSRTTRSTRQSCSTWTWATATGDLWAIERSYWRCFSSSNLNTESWGDKNSLGRGEPWRAGERGVRQDQDDHCQEWSGPESAGRWMMLVTYCRIGDLLQSMREDLIRPMRGVASDWSLLLHAVQRGVPSKTLSYDDTIDLINQVYPCITKVAAVLAAGSASASIFEYRYEDFTKEFRRATRALGPKDIVPCQCRHSGASLDKAGQQKTEKVEVRQQQQNAD